MLILSLRSARRWNTLARPRGRFPQGTDAVVTFAVNGRPCRKAGVSPIWAMNPLLAKLASHADPRPEAERRRPGCPRRAGLCRRRGRCSPPNESTDPRRAAGSGCKQLCRCRHNCFHAGRTVMPSESAFSLLRWWLWGRDARHNQRSCRNARRASGGWYRPGLTPRGASRAAACSLSAGSACS
jgi:hypothetical protein